MMNTRQEYKRKAKEEKRVYFHFELDRKYAEPRGQTSVAKWSRISTETADRIYKFINELEKEGLM